MFRTHFPSQRAVVVADPNTHAVAGQAVLANLRGRNLTIAEAHLLDDAHLYAEHTFVEKLEALFQATLRSPWRSVLARSTTW